MKYLAFLILGLIAKQSWSLPTQLTDIWEEVDDNIFNINRNLNLSEGDLLLNTKRSAILGNEYRWETPVPYTFDAGLDVNAKGVILKAFEQFYLKTCIGFKLQETEQNYISVQKESGCFSYVGNVLIGGQILSIGNGCDQIGIVEHEFLHALGFFHEQSRYDRDNYITIIWENIEKDKEHNFRKILKNESTTQGTPYDYNSLMHYGPNAFSNGNGTTIITKLPQFQDVIGQRLGMSHYDMVELNKLYNCTSSIAFLLGCSFVNETACELTRCSRSQASWESVTFNPGGPPSGHTNLGISEGTDFFMHFSTATGGEGDRAQLETKRMTPRRNCTVQCLQFYYYHSGNESDQLNIWMREFDDDNDPNGTRRLMGQITGPAADYWQLLHVPLNATKIFQVEFEGQKGEGNSSGGFSVDDINLSETECPHQTFQIRNVEQLIASTTSLYSPRYYSRDGYGYQMWANLKPNHTEVFVRLVSGENDDRLQWPCPWRQITIAIMDQNPDIQQRMSRQMSYTTDPKSHHSFVWDDPRRVGMLFNDSNGQSYYVNSGVGYNNFMTSEEMRRRDFMKAGDIFFLVNMEDISELRFNNALECNTLVQPQNLSLFSTNREDEGPCVTPPTTAPPPTTASSSIMVSSPVIVLLMVLALGHLLLYLNP
ncbi:hypothetical protein AAFF_G00126150 [Aldrovandia affinis]|uniref:Metalloendopeptidase n=1 Tax=Aldrovandia affinis TaxID=143900 RepID=A0AAD7WAH5_9TELE|nr:hypothetical protein AAFF_G00126150 [Aldrovandia affinis]